MKLQFKHQKFQADAAKAVVDVFAGQPYLTPTYMMDRGTGIFQIGIRYLQDVLSYLIEAVPLPQAQMLNFRTLLIRFSSTLNLTAL